MDPLNLLKELYGEEPIRKIMSSGFDSLSKIAAATPESLSFFAGIQEVLARQIIESAEEGRGAPSGKSSPQEPGAGASSLPTQPRELSRPSPSRKTESVRLSTGRVEPLDERPLLDAGGVIKSLSREPHPKEFLNDDDFLEEVGLSNAEAGFLQGISPWSSAAPRERHSPVLFEPPAEPDVEMSGTQELEFAPISDWSPEKEPDPVPRLVRAPELGPTPEWVEEPSEPLPGIPQPVESPPVKVAAPRVEPAPIVPAPRASFWKFGR
jgi:hypothetical protein